LSWRMQELRKSQNQDLRADPAWSINSGKMESNPGDFPGFRRLEGSSTHPMPDTSSTGSSGCSQVDRFSNHFEKCRNFEKCRLLPSHRNNFVEDQARGDLFNKSLPRRSSNALEGQLLCCSCAVAYAENFHGGVSFSGMWWSFVFGVRCF